MTEATTAAVATADRARAWPRALAGATALWALFDAVILLGTFPYWPRTGSRWALLLGAGPAMLLSLAGMLELAVLPRLRRRSPGSASSRLPGVLAVAVLGAALVALGAWWTLRVEGP